MKDTPDNSASSNPENEPPEAPIDVEDLRPHVFDGIQEYDKRMPNWWLWTFYGAIIFSVGYWIYAHLINALPDPGRALNKQLREAREAAVRNAPEMSDSKLWALSRDAGTVQSGKQIFDTTCASCHRPDLTGQIGPNLVDTKWIHGGKPLEIIKTVNEGVLVKGMPAWAPILGQTKVSEVAAYILSYHHEGEAIEIIASPTPGAAPAAAASSVIPPVPNN